MSRVLPLLYLLVSGLSGQSLLPRFAAETLSGRTLAMPAEAQGKQALLIVGFTRASGPHCTEWSKRLESEFKSDAAIQRYSVVFLEDVPRLIRGTVKGAIKGGVPQNQQDTFLIVTEHEREMKAAVRFETPDDAYLVLLGPDGTVRWTTHGESPSAEALRQIRERLQK